MRTAKNSPAYTYTRYDESSEVVPTHTYANFKSAKSFPHIHTHTLN